MDIGTFSDNAEMAISQLANLSYAHPDWTIERNLVGNFVVCDGGGIERFWLDLREGEVKPVLYPGEDFGIGPPPTPSMVR